MDWFTRFVEVLLVAACFFGTYSILSRRRASHAFLKSIVAGALGWFVCVILFSIGKVFIGLIFLALVVIGFFMFFRMIAGDIKSVS